MKRTKIEIVIYVILGLILAAFVFFAITSAFNLRFIVQLQRNVIANTSWKTFDVFVVSEWGMVATTAVLVILLVVFDERVYRKKLRESK
ncbi:MAG: hypothetical protein PHY11_04720 [Bacilli bacterium]|jgi:hypothetical protein|nr:hypothetical protein [Bacilli bacterium]MDD4066265.1 hypothetical protein [Bacilli bacterium]